MLDREKSVFIAVNTELLKCWRKDYIIDHSTIWLESLHSFQNCQVVHLSQAAACEGQMYSVNFESSNSGSQANLFPLFED